MTARQTALHRQAARKRPELPARPVEIVYSVAVSLDGYIADERGGVDWLHAAMVKGEGYGLAAFMSRIDAVMMGSRTYEQSVQMGGRMGPSLPCWVFSRRELPSGKGVHVTAAQPSEVVSTLPSHGVRCAWLMGGGTLAASFFADGLIDELSIAVMPVLLGSGIPLLGKLRNTVPLRLVESVTYKGGALGLRYVPAR